MIKEIKIELTNKCYRNCIHCSSEAVLTDEPEFIEIETVKRLIDEAITIGVTSVVFTGGEATLYKELNQAVKYAKEKGLNTKLYTMCHRNNENINLLKNLSEIGLDEIIYSTTKELIQDTTPELELLEFIKKLNQLTDLKIGFHHAVTNRTLNNMDDIFTIIKQIDLTKFTKISFLRYVPHGRGDASLLPSNEQIEQFKEKVQLLQKEYPNIIRLGSPYNVLGLKNTPCTAADETFIIGFDGRVYPCDAMKYFDYMGLGGNVYQNTLQEIFASPYFSNIRKFKVLYGDKCKKCTQFSICKGGCLGIKMICNFNDLNEVTFNWFELNAKRTMNDFETKNLMELNAKTGIAGETGELIDCIKKLFTHNCTTEKIEQIKQLMTDEIGDIIWYIAAPLASYYNFSLEEVADEIFKTNSKNIRKIDQQLIKYCAMSEDPNCPFKANSKKQHRISQIDDYIDKKEIFKLTSEWKTLDKLAYQLRTSDDKEEIIKYSAELLLFLAKIANLFLNTTLEQIIKDNIKRLQERYPTGFDTTVANNRINIEEKYKTDEIFGVEYGEKQKRKLPQS